jgi:hypothetical protein
MLEANKKHNDALEQGRGHHTETKEELKKLKNSVDLVKSSVDRLARARWIDWAILVAGMIAAIATVILLFR